MTRLLLLVPTSTYRAPDFLEAAERLGIEVVIGSPLRQAMAASMGDRAIVVPFDRPSAAAEAIAALNERRPLDAVVAVDDEGSLAAALASTRLGLRTNPPTALAATRDKITARRAFERAGVPQPDFRVVAAGEDPARAATDLGYPCVVKPPVLSASRGVIRVDSDEAARAAASRSRAVMEAAGDDPASPLLIERFLAGPEVAVEALLNGGALEVLAIFDKPDPLDGPYFEETIYTTPSRLPADDLSLVTSLVERATAAIGLVEGPVHAEVRPVGPDPRVLEVAARTIGGLCSRSLTFGASVSLEELVIRHAIGEPLDHPVAAGASGVMMLPIPKAGTFERVEGAAAALATPGITSLEITIPPGRPIRPPPEGDRYLGFLFARADGPAEAERALRRAYELLDIRISPDGTPDTAR